MIDANSGSITVLRAQSKKISSDHCSVKLLNQTRFPGEVPRFTDQATYATMLTKLCYLVGTRCSSLGTKPRVCAAVKDQQDQALPKQGLDA